MKLQQLLISNFERKKLKPFLTMPVGLFVLNTKDDQHRI